MSTHPILAIAPDKATIACIETHSLIRQSADADILSQQVSLRLVNAKTSQDYRVRLGSFGSEFEHTGLSYYLCFSPDSRYVAVQAGGRLWAVDVRSRGRRAVTGSREAVASCAWAASGGIAYTAITKPGGAGLQSFQKQIRISHPGDFDTGRLIYSCPATDHDWHSVCTGYWWPVDHWAPSGRYVLFTDTAAQDHLALLDVATGRLQRYGQTIGASHTAAWTADSSRVFFVAAIPGGPLQVLLVSVPLGEVTDLSREATAVFGKRVPSLEPQWTPDSRYVIANRIANRDPCLIQPAPWHVLQTCTTLKGRLGLDRNLPLTLERVPIQGCLATFIWASSVPTGLYAVSYDGDEYHVLFGARDIRAHAISADGSLAATVNAEGEVRLHQLALPTATQDDDNRENG